MRSERRYGESPIAESPADRLRLLLSTYRLFREDSRNTLKSLTGACLAGATLVNPLATGSTENMPLVDAALATSERSDRARDAVPPQLPAITPTTIPSQLPGSAAPSVAPPAQPAAPTPVPAPAPEPAPAPVPEAAPPSAPPELRPLFRGTYDKTPIQSLAMANFDRGPEIEDYAPQQRQTGCEPVERKGVVSFRDLTLTRYSQTGSYGIVRDCEVGSHKNGNAEHKGDSEHKEGRAWDWQVHVDDPLQRQNAEEMIQWLLATDRHGNTHANARRMGVMYIIWNGQIWSSDKPNEGFRVYRGSDPHVNHVHLSFSWAGAERVTSYWTGVVQTYLAPPALPPKHQEPPPPPPPPPPAPPEPSPSPSPSSSPSSSPTEKPSPSGRAKASERAVALGLSLN